MKKSMYQRGHTCSVCGCHLDSYDSFSIKFGKKDVYTCVNCDIDRIINNKIEENKELK